MTSKSSVFMEIVEDRHLPYIGYLPHDFNKTGAWRFTHPEIQEKCAPCRAGCALKSDVPEWMEKIKQNDFKAAWQIIQEYNPFPIITGYVCYHNCESNCNRGSWDESVAIKEIEKSIGYWRQKNEPEVAIGRALNKKVAIIGSGPAGLSCAYYLRKLGCKVTVYEQSAVPGGMLALCIPDYRLPKGVLRAEIEFLQKLGVEIKTEVTVGETITMDELQNSNDAVFIAVGAQKGILPDVPGTDKIGVYEAVDFLKAANMNQLLNVTKKVAVLGGGNTAIDAARMAIRLGAEDVTIIYRRSREEMPAHEKEIEVALNEGVTLLEQAMPLEFTGSERVSGVKYVKTQTQGRDKPIVTVEGSEALFEAGTVITATGQVADLDFLNPSLVTPEGTVATDNYVTTGEKGVFAGGDVTTGPNTVTDAIYWGRCAADAIRHYLEGYTREETAEYMEEMFQEEENLERATVSLEDLNTNYFYKHNRFLSSTSNSINALRMEVDRCFSCGTCNNCGICWIFCPDMSIFKDGAEKSEVNYDYCKGCGICAYECPRGVIEMVAGRGVKE